MSNTLKKYISIHECQGSEEGMIVTAIIPEEKYGKGVQITIGSKYVCLSEDQILDLIDTLLKRLTLMKGYAATDSNLGQIVLP